MIEKIINEIFEFISNINKNVIKALIVRCNNDIYLGLDKKGVRLYSKFLKSNQNCYSFDISFCR